MRRKRITPSSWERVKNPSFAYGTANFGVAELICIPRTPLFPSAFLVHLFWPATYDFFAFLWSFSVWIFVVVVCLGTATLHTKHCSKHNLLTSINCYFWGILCRIRTMQESTRSILCNCSQFKKSFQINIFMTGPLFQVKLEHTMYFIWEHRKIFMGKGGGTAQNIKYYII